MDVMRDILEHLNAYRFALNAALILIIARYLWLSRRSLYRESGALAIALGLFILGDDAIRFVAWISRRAANDGVMLSWPVGASAVSLAGGLIATLGAIGMIRVLSPAGGAWPGWALAIGGATMFTAAAAWW